MTLQLAVVLMFIAVFAGETQQKPGLSITLLHVNDHHSHLLADNFELNVSSYGLQSTNAATVKVSYGGYPRLVSLFRQLAAVNENVVKIHAGNAITGTRFYSLYQGEADAEMMSHVCFDMFELGNHEFDRGDAELAKFLDFLQSHQGSCPETPVLGANVVPGPSSALLGKLKNSTIKTFENDEKVGFVGIDTSFKVMASSKPDKGTVLSDDLKAAQWNIDELREQGVNKIVLVSHLGYDNDLALAPKLRGVNVIIGGDSHTLLSDTELPGAGWKPAGRYPTMVSNADGEKVCIVQAWEYAHALGELHVMFDADGSLLSCEGNPKFPFDGETMDASPTKLTAADADIVRARLEATPNFIAVAEDSSTKEALASYADSMVQEEARVIAQVPETLCFERVPGMGRSSICNVAAMRQHGSDITMLFASIYLEAVADGDLCIISAGSVRGDIAAGPLTFGDVYRVLLEDHLIQLRMTGQEIKQVLEDALDFVISNSAGSGGYPYAAGARYDVNATLPKGFRLSNIEINPHLSGEWSALESSRIYAVVTSKYIGSGKDGYVTFGKVLERAAPDVNNMSSVIDLHIMTADAVIEYAEKHIIMNKLPFEEYSTKSFTGLEVVLSVMYAHRRARWLLLVFTCFGFIGISSIQLVRKCKREPFEDGDLSKPILMS